MRLLYVITKSEAGGAQTQVLQLCRYFIEKGHKVAVMSYPGGWLEDELKKIGGKFYPNLYFSNSPNPWRLVLACKEINRSINDFKPNLINCHSSAAGILVRLVVRNKIPTIFNAVGWSFNIGVPMIQKYLGIISEKLAAYYCDKIISNSIFVKKLGLKYGIGSADKYVVVYNGVENNDLLKKNNSKVNDKIKIVFVARLAEPKDPIMFLQGYAALDEELKNESEVDIVGDGPKLDEVKQYILEHNLSHKVHLLGLLSREDVFKTLSYGDIFALCTKWESFPYTIIEGMFAGLACIASDVGGIAEALENNNGVLVKNTVDDWRDGLTRLLQDRNEIKAVGQRGKEKALREFSVEKMLSESEKVYMDVLKKYEKSGS